MEQSLRPFTINRLILIPNLTTAHLTTPVPKTASRSPSFLDFAVCAQTMQIAKKKLRKWSASFFKDNIPKSRSKKPVDQVRPIPRQKNPLQPNSKTAAEERPIMSLLYHPSTIRMRKIVLSNWSLLQACTELAKIFCRRPLLRTKRNAKRAPLSAPTSASKDRNPR